MKRKNELLLLYLEEYWTKELYELTLLLQEWQPAANFYSQQFSRNNDNEFQVTRKPPPPLFNNNELKFSPELTKYRGTQ
jgi:hypothetical protein